MFGFTKVVKLVGLFRRNLIDIILAVVVDPNLKPSVAEDIEGAGNTMFIPHCEAVYERGP